MYTSSIINIVHQNGPFLFFLPTVKLHQHIMTITVYRIYYGLLVKTYIQHYKSMQNICSENPCALPIYLLPPTPRADLQNGLVGSPCNPRDSQESSPTPQVKRIYRYPLFFGFPSHFGRHRALNSSTLC